MTAGGVGIFPAAAQLFQCVNARRIQQAVVRPVAANVGDDEGLGHQIGKVIGDVEPDVIPCDGDHGIEQEISGEYSEPSQNVLNGLHPRLGKWVEIGTIYTTVAGLLNVLAIYDALEGPAYHEEEAAESPAESEELVSALPAGAAGRNLTTEGSA